MEEKCDGLNRKGACQYELFLTGCWGSKTNIENTTLKRQHEQQTRAKVKCGCEYGCEYGCGCGCDSSID